MDLKSGYPYWAIKNGLMHSYPRLCEDVDCDIAIVGGGITAALIADELAHHGHDVVVVEQRDIAWGSSAASTALLQYEIDTHMTELCRRYGEKDAALAYRACAEALPMLAEVARSFRDVDHRDMDSLYIASRRWHARSLRDEFALRERHGFDVELLESDRLADDYGIDSPVAILSHEAASIDPYRLAYRLFARLAGKGVRVFDRTEMIDFKPGRKGVVLETSEGARIRAGFLVLAAGYANQKWIGQRVAANRSSYAFITDPIDTGPLGIWKDTLLWESARPYLYMRSTGDGRLLVGGDDDDIDIPAKRDARVHRKADRLRKRIRKYLPHLDMKPAFAWAGTFAETADGLPFFGTHPKHGPRVLFAMAYGGNGITYSMIGAGLLRASIEKRKHPLASLFSFRRLDR
jgi:glycine/D-amino acid oxidase-like deaminating enzyme